MRATVLAVIGIGGLGGSGLVGAEEKTKPVVIHLEGERSATFGEFQKAGVRFRNPHYQPPDQRPRPAIPQASVPSATLSLQSGVVELVLQQGERDPLRIVAKDSYMGSFTRQYPDRTQEYYEPKPVVDEKSVLTGCLIGTSGTAGELREIVLALGDLIEGDQKDLKAWLDHRLWEKESLQTYLVRKGDEDLRLLMTVHGVVDEEGKDHLNLHLEITWPRLRPEEPRRGPVPASRPRVMRPNPPAR